MYEKVSKHVVKVWKGNFTCINIKKQGECECCQYKKVKLISILIHVEKINIRMNSLQLVK